MKQKPKACPVQNKQQYPSQGAAIRAALSFSKKRGAPLRVYWHAPCKSYHLTRKSLRVVDTHDRGSA